MGQEPFVELLAPAGNREGFYGAIHAGADAVYLGGTRFGARAYADNFTTGELLECIRYAHLWGRKVYLTVNTLVKESELEDLYEYLKPCYEGGLDGAIVQDIGALALLREHFPGMELHASTQMTLTGVHGASLVKDMGACRIVPARELSLQELVLMKQETGLSMEVFIHGAMCYCYSGQCLFSSILGGRSGNRGRCAQPCRLPYRVETGRGSSGECFPLSLKDMCTIEHIPELIEAGIDSFKIEGRMKKPEYAAGVTAVYRKYIDLYYADHGKAAWEIAPEDLDMLAGLYIRSKWQDGYYHKHNGRDMVTLESPAYSGSDEALLAGIRRRYIEQRPKMPVEIEAVFLTGEDATVTFTLGEISVTARGGAVPRADRQPITRENIERQLGKLGDSIFSAKSMKILVGEEAFYPLGALNELRRKAVGMLEETVIRRNGFPLRRDAAAVALHRNVETAAREMKAPCREAETAAREMGAAAREMEIPYGEREAAAREMEAPHREMEAAAREMEPAPGHGRTFLVKKRDDSMQGLYQGTYSGFTLSLRTMEQLDALVNYKNRMNGRLSISRIYIDSDLLVRLTESVIGKCRMLAEQWEIQLPELPTPPMQSVPPMQSAQVMQPAQPIQSVQPLQPARPLQPKQSAQLELALALPYIIRQQDDAYFDRLFALIDRYQGLFSGILVRSLDGMGLLRDWGYQGRIYTDAGFYIWNRKALREWEPCISGFCLPYELKAAEQRALARQALCLRNLACEKVVYGRIPMMLAANCVAKTTERCLKDSGEGIVYLIDRYRKRFPVELNCIHCMNIIYNSVPLSLHGELAKWKGGALFRMDFTVENGEETRQVLDFFASLSDSVSPRTDVKKEGKMEIRKKNRKSRIPTPPFGEYTTGHEKRGLADAENDL